MNDFGALQNLIEAANKSINSNYNLTLALLGFVFVNFFLTCLNIFFQFKLKNKEKSINSYNLKEAKRIETQDELYRLLEELTYYDGTNTHSYQVRTAEINKFLTQKKIYLSKNIIKISQNFNDYFLTVLGDYRRKNYSTEMEYLEEYNKAFNND
ncbi:MAG: hypothetical protein WCJ62_03190 [Flavobacterium sp.]